MILQKFQIAIANVCQHKADPLNRIREIERLYGDIRPEDRSPDLVECYHAALASQRFLLSTALPPLLVLS